MESGEIYYAKIDDAYVLRFSGAIRYTLCSDLESLIDQIFESPNFYRILVDLTEASCIDSTSLGLLAKISILTASRGGSKPTIISTNEDINEILESVGFDDIFRIVDLPEFASPQCAVLPHINADKEHLGDTILDAHRILCQLNENNLKMFKGVVEALESTQG